MAAWHDILDSHHPCQPHHPQQTLHPNAEHHKHQRPAVAQAKDTMPQAQMPRWPYPFAIVAPKETKWAATLVQTIPFERAKLEASRESQSCSPYEAWMFVQPGPAMDDVMDLGIT